MPAIQPTRLARQVETLLADFDDPTAFSRGLHDLLDFYADRTLRSTQVIESAPLLHSYRVPPPVLREIERQLRIPVARAPENALSLADQLWAERWLETRLLAIVILSILPVDDSAAIIARIELWGQACKEDKVLRALLAKGLARVYVVAPEAYLELLENWLGSSDLTSIHLGIRALPTLLRSEKFENLPLVYRWLAPLTRNIETEFKDDLQNDVRLLARRSPQETAYFLRQALNAATNKHTVRLVRRVLSEFPPNLQHTLQAALREARHRS